MINKRNYKKYFSILIIIIIISSFTIFLISFEYTINLQKYSNKIDNELDNAIDELMKSKNDLDHNNTKLKELLLGDKFNLRDPLYEEVESFINQDNSSTIKEKIKNAKNQGLNCSLVEILMGEDLKLYQLIGFNTVDKGMKYYELKTNYKVFPEIGKSYVQCVFDKDGKNPYFRNFNDTIVNIIVIW